jgi:hypothetical protein
MVELKREQIQGNILHGYNYPEVQHLFGTPVAKDAGRWKAFLGSLKASCATQRVESGTALNIGFSAGALRTLGADPDGEIQRHFEAFSMGMRARSALLGDRTDTNWDDWTRRSIWLCLHSNPRESPRPSRSGRQGTPGQGA